MSAKEYGPISYRLLVASVPLFIVLYVAVSLILPRVGIHGEQYLLYSWFVFHSVPHREEVTFEAYILEPRYERLESSRVFIRDELRNTPEYRRRVRLIGELLTRGDSAGAAREREALEAFALERPLTYEIVEVRYDPLERYRTGAVLATTSLGVYTVSPL